MKKIVFILFFCYFTISLFHHSTNSLIHQFTIPLLFAEVNLLEPLRAGVESKIPEKTNTVILEGGGFELAERHWELPFFLTFCPSADYELGAKVAIIGHKQASYWTNGIGDILIAGKYLFFRESLAYPGIFAEAGISLPSGDYYQGLGNGSFGFLAAGGIERTIGEIHQHAFLSYRLNLFENSAGMKFGNSFGYTLGIGCPLKKPLKLSKEITLFGDWKVFAELKGTYHSADKMKGSSLNNAYHELYLSAGAKYKSKWGEYALSLLLGLTPDSYSYRVYFSARY